MKQIKRMFVTITFTKMIILTKYILYLFFVFLTIRHRN